MDSDSDDYPWKQLGAPPVFAYDDERWDVPDWTGMAQGHAAGDWDGMAQGRRNRRNATKKRRK